MAEQDPRAPSDLVSFEPRVDDTRAFTIGLWTSEILLFSGLVAGLTLFRDAGDGVRVGTACAGMGLFVAVTAIVLRGRLQLRPGVGRRIAAVLALVALAAWTVAVILVSSVSASASPSPAVARTIGLDTVGLVVQTAALVAAYRARMFRWLAD
ncbi:hypothetical protein [Frondihabitans peucedani]|uniref:Integral membrane protein n=1 Tax=Frondihabitans peucedani TaxID=598626 RepID=A0ABP8DXR1_9MICO